MASSKTTFHRSVTCHVKRVCRLWRLLRFLIRNDSSCGSFYGISTGNLGRLFTCNYFCLIIGSKCFRRRLRNKNFRLKRCTLLCGLFSGRQGDRGRIELRFNRDLRGSFKTKRTDRRRCITACNRFVRGLRYGSMRVYR